MSKPVKVKLNSDYDDTRFTNIFVPEGTEGVAIKHQSDYIGFYKVKIDGHTLIIHQFNLIFLEDTNE